MLEMTSASATILVHSQTVNVRVPISNNAAPQHQRQNRFRPPLQGRASPGKSEPGFYGCFVRLCSLCRRAGSLTIPRSIDPYQAENQLHPNTGCTVFCPPREVVMKSFNAKRLLLVVAVLALGIFGSIDLSQSDGLALSIQSAEARVGRPLTPVSVAGVARRTTRRAVVGGAAVGAAAAGTACVRVLVNGAYVCR